ncbi:MAG: hypothetical protein ACRDAX_06580 [Propionibacteriaceae bacterium]
MNSNLRQLSIRMPLSLVSSGVGIGFCALLVELLVAAVAGSSGSRDFRGSMLISGIISVPAIFLSLVFALRQSFRLRQPAWDVVENLGLAERKIRSYLLLENLVLAALGLVLGAVLLQPTWALLRATLYAAYAVLAPARLAFSPKVALLSLIVLVTIVFLAHLVAVRGLGQHLSYSRSRVAANRWLRLGGLVLGVLLASGLLISATRGVSPLLVSALLGPAITLTVPALARYSCVVVAKLFSRKPNSALRLGGLIYPGLKMAAAITTTVIAISLPLAMLGFGATGEAGTREVVSRAATTTGAVAVVDGKSFIPSEVAAKTCQSLGQRCAGILEIVIHEVPIANNGTGVRRQYELIGDSSVAERIIQPELISGRDLGPNFLGWPWRTYRDSVPETATKYGALVVLQSAEDTTSISAQEALRKLPSQLFYGPRGTGNREFVSLMSYTLFAGVLFLFIASLIQLVRAHEVLQPLADLGMAKTIRSLAAAAALIIPVIVLSAIVAICCLIFCVIVFWRMTGIITFDGSWLALPTTGLLLLTPTAIVAAAVGVVTITQRNSK